MYAWDVLPLRLLPQVLTEQHASFFGILIMVTKQGWYITQNGVQGHVNYLKPT